MRKRSNTSLSTPSKLKAPADGSIVITLPPGLTIIFYSHKPSEADPTACAIAVGKCAPCYSSRPIVATIAMRKVATILQLQRSFNGHNLGAGFDLDHTAGQAQSIRSALYSAL
jgi:hypothetical protein